MDIAKQLDKKIAKAALSAEVEGEVWDLIRPLEQDCSVRILSWEDGKGKDVSACSQLAVCHSAQDSS